MEESWSSQIPGVAAIDQKIPITACGGRRQCPIAAFGLLGAVAILCVRDATCVAKKVAGGVGLATAASIDYTALTLPKYRSAHWRLTKKAPHTAGLYREGRRRRCIIPVDGFFEWKAIKGQKAKQPPSP
jgi:hypothetical protein